MARINKKAQAPVPVPRTTQKPATKGQEAPPPIRKGIYLSALIYVEGEQAAPDDFTALATSALKTALSTALKADHNGLSMTLKKLEAQNDVEEESSGEPANKGKFQF